MKIILTTIVTFLLLTLTVSRTALAADANRFWQIQSVDTMKFSRDEAKIHADDPAFEKIITQQVKQISEIGATHVAVATPYDDEFYPFLKKWVTAARDNHLKVWFRGNFAGWEGWFGYNKISRDQHLGKIPHFILTHPDLFEAGDIFSPCTECENGGPGDARTTGDVEGHRLFLESEYRASLESFKKIGKDVLIFNSMNGDVAKLIMDPRTTEELGGIVVVDHYVKTPEILATDLIDLANSSHGNIILGEFGAPIPDINGPMTEKDQAAWIEKTLDLLSGNDRLVGLNYWTSVRGSTALWSEAGEPRAAVAILRSFFIPKAVSGLVTNPFGKPIKDVEVSIGEKKTRVDKDGYYLLPHLDGINTLVVTRPNGQRIDYSIDNNATNFNIIIGNKPSGLIQYLLGYLESLFSN
jgi:hypothetical protein